MVGILCLDRPALPDGRQWTVVGGAGTNAAPGGHAQYQQNGDDLEQERRLKRRRKKGDGLAFGRPNGRSIDEKCDRIEISSQSLATTS